MPSIRDLVEAIRTRDGVDAAVILGRDGLLIDSHVAPGVDAEAIAARIPSIVTPADDLGQALDRGALTTSVLEFERGFAIISVMSAEAILLVLVQRDADLGQLLHELRRHRGSIAALV
ncbi:MAG: roadblock/LC7 domain-containing protein [Gemmatimonadaceae bacterium]|nr:roadblock/LC7 domain-containing protein [Gemmatimonadaceae bacterium]